MINKGPDLSSAAERQAMPGTIRNTKNRGFLPQTSMRRIRIMEEGNSIMAMAEKLRSRKRVREEGYLR